MALVDASERVLPMSRRSRVGSMGGILRREGIELILEAHATATRRERRCFSFEFDDTS